MSLVGRLVASKRKSSERAFQDPAVGRDGNEPAEEELEGDALSQARDPESCLCRLALQPVVESLAERCGGRVFHRSGSSVFRTRVLP
jgi:hypothetical protein